VRPNLRGILSALDVLSLALSPMALLGFLVLVIVTLDAFGAHVQMLQAIDADGMDASGRWMGFSSDGTMGTIQVEQPGADALWLVIYAKHYQASTLAQLQEGQTVSVRYTSPPQHEQKAILSAASAEVHAYTGYLSSTLWPMLACWLVLIVHPEVLFFGLERAQAKTP
jgi:hypothetical protein